MSRKNIDQTFIIIVSGIFFLSFLGNTNLFDWDEVNFAESAREMIVTGDYASVQINFKPFWEKPPLFFWLQAFAMKVFNVFAYDNYFTPEFAARFPNAIAGIITLLVFYNLGNKLKNRALGLVWVLIYLGSFTPHLYFKSGIIDPVFNLFIFLGIWQTYLVILNNKPAHGIWAGVFIGLSVLTKGPVGMLLWGLTLISFWAIQKFSIVFLKNNLKNAIIALLSMLLVSSLWFAIEIYQHGLWFVNEFITYQIRLFKTEDAGHGQPFYYHFLVVLLGCFPLSIFGLKSFFYKTNPDKSILTFRQLMLCLFWVVMILFSIVRTKIVHYSSMAWFPLSFLAAQYITDWLDGKTMISFKFKTTLLIIGLLMAIVLIGLPLVGANPSIISPYIKDAFAVANLKAPVLWSGFEKYIGLGWFIAILLGIYWLEKNKVRALVSLFGSTALCLFFYSWLVIKNIEGYTQRTAIDFYQSKKGQDVYIEPIGFKSYAQLFYLDKQPGFNKNSYDENWLLNGKVDKPTFFICKINEQDQLKNNPNVDWIKEENGFVFYKRKLKVAIQK